jgi:mannose-6-phosphate isomerase
MQIFNLRPYVLSNKIMPYAWGTKGKKAFIPRFLGVEPEINQSYAELWMGTHPTAPSEIIVDRIGASLLETVSRYPNEILGENVIRDFGERLPFLLKVISVADVLSIQAHPNKQQAERLNLLDPEHYPDANHKPEIVIALGTFKCFAGFKDWPGILSTLEKYPEFVSLVGSNNHWDSDLDGSKPSERTKLLFSTLMSKSNDHETLIGLINQLALRLSTLAPERLTEEQLIFLKLKKDYPDDIGLFALLLLNPVHLEKYQAMYIAPGIPHAYLEGDAIECMAASDNVVRAGLTKKFKDIPTLINILNYETTPVFFLESSEDASILFQTPTAEFQIARKAFAQNEQVMFLSGNKPRILLVMDGEIELSWENEEGCAHENFQRGQSILVPARLSEVRLSAKQSSDIFDVTVP